MESLTRKRSLHRVAFENPQDPKEDDDAFQENSGPSTKLDMLTGTPSSRIGARKSLGAQRSLVPVTMQRSVLTMKLSVPQAGPSILQLTQEAEEAEPEGTQGSLVTIFAIWNAMMGSSLLLMPWAIAKAGFALGICLTIFLGGLSYYTCSLVLKTSAKSEDEDANASTANLKKAEFFDFGETIEFYLGKIASMFGIVVSLLTFLGALVAYWIFLSTFLFNIGNIIHQFVTGTGNSTAGNFGQVNQTTEKTAFAYYWSVDLTVPIYMIAILFPIFCVRKPTVFTKFTALGVGSVVVLVGYVIYKAATWGLHMDVDLDPSIINAGVSFPAISGSLSMGYFIHNGILPITAHHENPKKKQRDLGIAYFAVAMTYLLVGIVYYVTFPGPKKDIADNFLKMVSKDDIFGFVASCFLFFQMVTVCPLMLFMLRTQFMTQIMHKKNYRFAWIFAINCVVVLICVRLAIFWPKAGSVIRFIGATAGFVYNYTFPSLVYLAALRAVGKMTKLSVVAHVAIVIFGLLNLIGQCVINAD